MLENVAVEDESTELRAVESQAEEDARAGRQRIIVVQRTLRDGRHELAVAQALVLRGGFAVLVHHDVGVHHGELHLVDMKVVTLAAVVDDAALSFGGPAGQIAVMHRVVVDEKRWIGEARFLHALSYCTLLPGLEAQQLAIYIGWLMHGTRGGVVAGSLCVLAGAVAIMALSVIYAGWGQVGAVSALFFGLKAAVLAVVLQAVLRLGGRALGNATMLSIAALAFVAIFILAVPFPVIVLAAGATGYSATRAGSTQFRMGGHGGGRAGPDAREGLLGDSLPDPVRPAASSGSPGSG